MGAPVISSGPNKGKPKEVGITASGTRARRGTLAADTAVLPFGTIVEVPGYGFGRVEDRGGAIKGNRLDLWFPSHGEAQQWGRQKGLRVRVWKP
ncbi:MAG: 3D domain-containing protein [Kiritimatiellia bacterium]